MKPMEVLKDEVFDLNGEEEAIYLVDFLKEKKLKISTAESCTGGLVSQLITSVSGASDVFEYGFVTYANEAKTKILGVKPETLKSVGAVSADTAREMAIGAKEKSGSDIAVSLTGIAGPTGGTEEKPVGLVYAGFAFKNESFAFEYRLKGSRDEIRMKAAAKTLEAARLLIESDE